MVPRSFLALLLGGLLLLGQAQAAPLDPSQVPGPLQDWTSWVLLADPSHTCPRLTGDTQTRPCVWPATLRLALDDAGGTFNLEVETFADRPLSEVHRFVRLLDGGLSEEAKAAVSRGFADGFRLLLSRIQAQGLSRELRCRCNAGPVFASPFHRILRSGDALLDAWTSGRDTAAALQAFNKDSGACRKEVRVIQRHLEDAGVSVDVVFGLEVIDRCLTRTALMADVMEGGDGPERSRAIHRLLSRLVRLAHEDKSILHLVRWNLHLLDRKIVDRTGKTGEHYVAGTPSEYRHIWLAAAGGGALTVLTAAFKMLVHEWHLAAFPESFLYGLNYAVSFLLMQSFGLVLATKQPAMTAAALAQIMREAKGEDREERIAGFFARLTSSQLAAAISNVATVGVGAAVFVGGWLLLAGRPWVDEKTAKETFLVLSPLDSGTIFFAALTGVLLWMGSLAGGWFENWSACHRLPEGIARHPLGRVFGSRSGDKGSNANLGVFARSDAAWTWLDENLKHVGKRSSVDVRSTFLAPS